MRTDHAIVIDGDLTESVWEQAEAATGFTQLQQVAGAKPAKRTWVRVLYDDEALYVGAWMEESGRDSVLRQLSPRDQFSNTDHFGITIDTYQSGLNGFGFFVGASGVQFDEQYSDDNGNRSWNAVWESDVNILDNGWSVEMRIPYSALRFNKADEYVWRVNFKRTVRRIRQENWWSEVDPNVDGFLTQSGYLTGIRDIEPPTRLMFYPYVSTFIEHFPNDDPAINDLSTTYNGGMDVKYGISDAFTLDMTLVPDFNQALSDRQVLNLSPFEVRFNENRQFFTEGTELFNKGGWFYSRRVGGRPFFLNDVEGELSSDEELVDAVVQSRLLNATKISGRTEGGLGVGVFNGITAEEFGTVVSTEQEDKKVLIDPLTNYSVVVFDQLLKNNSYVTLVNTNVLRAGDAYDANLTGLTWKAADKRNMYAVRGDGAFNQKFFSDSVGTGHTYYLSFDKISGNWTYGLDHGVESDTYDPNDLGFLFNNNSRNYSTYLRYSRNDPWLFFNRHRVTLSTVYERIYDPNAFSNFAIYLNSFFFTKNIVAFGLNMAYEPIKTYDFFETREQGRFYTYPENFAIDGFVSTDYSKRFAIDVNLWFRRFNEPGRKNYGFALEPRFRVNDRLAFVYWHQVVFNDNDIGWVNTVDEDIIFGRRDRLRHTQNLQADFIFTDRMGITSRIRHVWDRVGYNKYFLVADDGDLVYTDYDGLDENGQSDHQVNFSAFNVDLVFSWFFRPGSELSIGYKNAIGEVQTPLDRDLIEAWGTTFAAAQRNSLSIKLLWFVDYQELRGSRRSMESK